MTYRNKRTGETIITSNRVGGKNWEPVEDESREQAMKAAAAEETAEETTEAVPPVEEQPQHRRRGKK